MTQKKLHRQFLLLLLLHIRALSPILWMACLFFFSCSKDDTINVLAPYAGGGRSVSTITVEDSVFNPQMTWLGGFAAAVGANKGPLVRLDSSLVWLLHGSGNTVRFPARVGSVPEGTESLVARYHGRAAARLTEDDTYTYWVMKEDAWMLVADSAGRVLLPDTLKRAALVSGDGNNNDTLFVNPASFVTVTKNLNLFTDITNLQSRGQLGTFSVTATDTNNSAFVRFTLSPTAGTTDSTVCAVGLVRAGQYEIASVVWEVLSVDTVGGKPVYWKSNKIRSPYMLGEKFPGTIANVEFSAQGLERGQDYYLWVAGKDWDQINRLRGTKYYAWATFHVY